MARSAVVGPVPELMIVTVTVTTRLAPLPMLVIGPIVLVDRLLPEVAKAGAAAATATTGTAQVADRTTARRSRPGMAPPTPWHIDSLLTRR